MGLVAASTLFFYQCEFTYLVSLDPLKFLVLQFIQVFLDSVFAEFKHCFANSWSIRRGHVASDLFFSGYGESFPPRERAVFFPQLFVISSKQPKFWLMSFRSLNLYRNVRCQFRWSFSDFLHRTFSLIILFTWGLFSSCFLFFFLSLRSFIRFISIRIMHRE